MESLMEIRIKRRDFLATATVTGATSAARAADQSNCGARKRIIVIGATARTADDLIPQAIWRGFDVIAVARRPQRVRYQAHPQLRLVKADVYDADAMAAAFSGKGDEAVVSVFGPRVEPTEEIPDTDLMSKGTENIIALMKKNGNKRLFVTSSGAVGTIAKLGYTAVTPKPAGLTLETGLWYYTMRGPYIDMGRMEKIALASGLQSTVLRPEVLIEEPARGDALLAVNESPPRSRFIAYADFAAFILDNLDTSTYVGKTVGVYSPREVKFGENINVNAELKKLHDTMEQVKQDLSADKNKSP